MMEKDRTPDGGLDPHLTRRTALKQALGVSVAAASTFLISHKAMAEAVTTLQAEEPALPVQLAQSQIPIPPANAQTFTTACQYCNVACGYIVKVWPVGDSAPQGGGQWPKMPMDANGGWPSPAHFQKTIVNGVDSYVWIQPDKDCVVNRGDHSTRGGTNALTVYSPTPTPFSDTTERILYPMMRGHKGGALKRVSWTAAINRVADELAKVYKQRGPTALACWRADHECIEDNYAFGKLMLGPKPIGLYDTSLPPTKAIPQMAIHNRPKYASETPSYEDIVGPGGSVWPYTYEDLEIAKVVVYAGVNGYETGSTLYNRMYTAGPKLVAIDPRKTLVAENARQTGGYHLQLIPNTDIVLANAMMHHIVSRGLQDQAFIDAHIEPTTWQAVKANVLQSKYHPVEAARVTGVSAPDIMAVAELIAHNPTVILAEKGLTWQGELNPGAWAGYVNLALITGNIGKPGASVGRQGGHQDALVETGWPNPIKHGVDRPDVWTSIANGEIYAMWQYDGDPWTTTQNLAVFRKKLQEIPFLVCQNIYPNGTTNVADVILPSAAWGERNFVRGNLERRIRLYSKFMDPPGEAKPDWDIVAMVGRALGTRHQLVDPAGFAWADHTAIFNELKQSADGIGMGLHYLTEDSLRAMGTNGIQWPIVKKADGSLEGTPRLYVNGQFNYPDGKARLQVYDVQWTATDPHAFMPPVIRPTADYPYRLITGRINVLWQSTYNNQRMPTQMQQMPYAEVFINPADATQLGVGDGDFVDLYNELDTVQLMTRISDVVPAGIVFAPFAYAGNKVNALIPSTYRCPRNAAYFKNSHVGIRSSKAEPDVVTSFASYNSLI